MLHSIITVQIINVKTISYMAIILLPSFASIYLFPGKQKWLGLHKRQKYLFSDWLFLYELIWNKIK